MYNLNAASSESNPFKTYIIIIYFYTSGCDLASYTTAKVSKVKF